MINMIYQIMKYLLAIMNIDIDRTGVFYDPYYKYYKDLNSILKNISNGKHICTVFDLKTLKYFNEIFKFNRENL